MLECDVCEHDQGSNDDHDYADNQSTPGLHDRVYGQGHHDRQDAIEDACQKEAVNYKGNEPVEGLTEKAEQCSGKENRGFVLVGKPAGSQGLPVLQCYEYLVVSALLQDEPEDVGDRDKANRVVNVFRLDLPVTIDNDVIESGEDNQIEKRLVCARCAANQDGKREINYEQSHRRRYPGIAK